MTETITVSLRQLEDYRFLVDFEQPGAPDLVTDEPAPLGSGAGPNPARMLAAAVGNCLGASLLFCLAKRRIDVHGMECTVAADITRNQHGRLRIAGLRVRVSPSLGDEDLERIGRCSDLFEDFCIVTESVRAGIDVQVEVVPTAALVAK